MRVKTQHGFTLIELMLVVSIIGILAAIALAAYDSEVKRARMAEIIIQSAVPGVARHEHKAREALHN